jgi:hypothetical protein
VPSGDRALTAPVEEALRRQRNAALPYWDAYGPVVPPRGEELVLSVADVAVAVFHELGEIPEGMHVVRADGPIYAAPGVQWTKELAFVQTSRANTRARFIFFTCRGNQA